MLIYSTRFRVKKTFAVKEFITSIINWNKKSMYAVDGIENEADNDSFIAGDDNNYIEVIHCAKRNVIACRNVIDQKNGHWETEIVLNYGTSVLSVYVNRSMGQSSQIAAEKAFVPRFIDQVIKAGFAEKSTGLDITGNVIFADAETIRNAVSVTDRYSLPIVYISSAAKITPSKLAPKLEGLAAVVFDEKDSLLDEYPAPITVFFPQKNIKPAVFGDYPYHRDIQKAVIRYLNGREYDKLETWNGVQNEIINIRNAENLIELRKQADENDSLIELAAEFEKRYNEEKKQRELLAAQNAELKRKLEYFEYLQNMKNEEGQPVIVTGKEKDLYNNEQTEIIISILKEYRNNSISISDDGKTTRREDILNSIIDANPVENIPDKYAQIIKRALDGYTKADSKKIKDAFDEVGIKLVSHTGHYKYNYHGDNRYSYELAATSSDVKAGLNAAAKIKKLMF